MSSLRNRTTPGVYVTEFNAFPNSIPGVQTAIPAFIGYTQKAKINGKQVTYKPILINSLADYEAIFGIGFDTIFKIDAVVPTVPDDYDFASETWDAAGGPAGTGGYVPKYYKLTATTDAKLPPMMLAREDDLDEEEERPTEVDTAQQSSRIRPTMNAFNLYNSVRLFYANGGGSCFICSTGPYSAGGVEYTALDKGLNAVADQMGPTMLVVPDAVLLAKADFAKLSKSMLKQCHDLQDRVAVLDVHGTQTLNAALPVNGTFARDVDLLVEDFQKDVGEDFLNYGMAYFPFLETSIIQDSEVDYRNFTPVDSLVAILTDQASYDYPGTDSSHISPTTNDNPTYVNKIKPLIDAINGANGVAQATTAAAVIALDQNLTNAIPILAEMENAVAAKMSLLPASGAMAGLFTFNDASRGVWNAPANHVLNAVTDVNVKINADMQGPLNVPINGKAVNVIRDFPGRGPVVWGARTLDGNSNDWRYVQVRRTIVYIETSVRTALNQFVFAPNTGTTWVAVTAMVSAFLQNLWQQGGLMGAKPDEAFTVQCGLGSTMTGMDVLQGYMVVQITLQMIRPAEFIELTFKQKMEGLA